MIRLFNRADIFSRFSCCLMATLSRYPFLLVLMTCTNLCFAQSGKYSVISIPYKDVEKLFGAVDGEGNICIYYNTGYEEYFTLYNKSGEIVKTIPMNINDILSVDDILYTESEFCVYYSNSKEKNKTTNLLKINKADGVFDNFLKIPLIVGSQEKKISNFNIDNKLYYVCANRATNTLVLNIFDGSEVPNTIRVDAKMPNIFKHFNSENPVANNASKEGTIYQGHFKHKAFLQNNTLYFVTDACVFHGGLNNVEVLSVDLVNKLSDYQFLKLPNFFTNQLSNSYLVDSLLFRLTIAKKNFDLSIFDIHSMKLLKQHAFGLDDEFYLKDGLLIKDVDKNDLLSTDIYKDDNAYVFRQLYRGTPSIIGQKVKNSKISLQIGSYQPPSANVGGAPMFAPGGAINTPYGTASIPGTWNPSPSWGNMRGEGTSIYFRTAVDILSLEKSTYVPTKNQYVDRAINRLQESDLKLGNMTVFTNGSDYYVAYVNRKTKEIVVKQLKSGFGF
jgi:hypothetical protein